jgi:hypothetical protein
MEFSEGSREMQNSPLVENFMGEGGGFLDSMNTGDWQGVNQFSSPYSDADIANLMDNNTMSLGEGDFTL